MSACLAPSPLGRGCVCRCHDHGENCPGICDHACCRRIDGPPRTKAGHPSIDDTITTDARKWVEYDGYRIYAPFLCTCCGRETSQEQFAFGRMCAPSDVGACDRENRAYLSSAEHASPSWTTMREYMIAVGAEVIPA